MEEGKFCKFCGKNINPGERFCTRCGNDLRKIVLGGNDTDKKEWSASMIMIIVAMILALLIIVIAGIVCALCFF